MEDLFNPTRFFENHGYKILQEATENKSKRGMTRAELYEEYKKWCIKNNCILHNVTFVIDQIMETDKVRKSFPQFNKKRTRKYITNC